MVPLWYKKLSALVSETWKILAENVLIKRWKGKIVEACKNGETKVVQLLLERCDSEESGLNIKDEEERTAFIIACKNGHRDVVQLLLDHSKRIDMNARDNDGLTAFMWACHEGQKDVVKYLLDHSGQIDLNVRDISYLCQKVCKPKRSNFAGYALFTLSAWKFILEAIPGYQWMLHIKTRRDSNFVHIECSSFRREYFFFFVTLSCKLKARRFTRDGLEV